MNNLNIKKTLNLRRFSVNIRKILSYYNLFIPIICSILGLFIGSCIAKGEGWLYISVEKYILAFVLNQNINDLKLYLLSQMILPTVFSIILFFCGLSVYGCMISNFIPLIYSIIIGIITYYFYSNYVLKGLAYCVIIVFPYAILSLFSLILISVESVSMSQVLSRNLINSNNYKTSDYNFRFYCKSCLKSYLFIIAATVIKTFIDYLFIDIFVF